MEENWFIFKEDHHLGPFTADTLLLMLEEHQVSENVLVWKEGFDAWLPLKDCPEFQFEIEEDEGHLLFLHYHLKMRHLKLPQQLKT